MIGYCWSIRRFNMFKKFKELLEDADLNDIAIFLLVVILAVFVLSTSIVLIVVAIKGSDYNINHNVKTVVDMIGGLK